MTEGVPQFIQVIVILSCGSVIFWLFSFVSKVIGLVNKQKDYADTMASKSRDPEAMLTTLQQKRQIKRLKAAIIATIILALALWLHSER